ncbi:MAG TPA: phospholipase D-like domain-containing protein [Solirubrobacteraceae bacterium]|nr:phospholipase D-like domain-containing protein [Solirubrobacteraceae bacterium]
MLGAVVGVLVISTCRAAAGSVNHATARSYYRLVQYPDAGFGGFYRQIRSAHRTIDMEMYELDDRVAERDLADAAARGVRVRVLLDEAFTGGEVNRDAARYLAAHGVQVRRAPAGYIFHIKTTTFDATTSDISSANLVAKYYRTTRDAEVVDSDPVQVRAIEQTFSNDWAAGASGRPSVQTVQAPGLVWSPDTGSGTAEAALVKQIRSAHKTVDFESEELSDRSIYRALAADARRGVKCRVAMTRSSEWDPAFRTITRAGCHVHLFADSSTALYIHEKMILTDHGTTRESLLIGSQNASVTSLTRNRELSIVLERAHGGGSAIAAASATFGSDFHHGMPWSLPTPTGRPKPKPKPTPPRTPAPTRCYPRSGSGNCYEPGEYCSKADHGKSGIAGNGEAIVCEDNNGWRWEPK